MKITIHQANKENVLSVYSGKPGCMCGCKGKHYYNPSFREEGERSRGYAISKSELNAGMLTRVIGILQSVAGELEADGDHFYAHVDGREYVVYLRDGFEAEGPMKFEGMTEDGFATYSGFRG